MRNLDIKIRPYRPADFDTVTWLRLHSWKSNGAKTPIFGTALTFNRRQLRERLIESSVRIATINSRIVGFVAIRETEIVDLFVACGFQRRGIGKHLLNFAKAQRPDGFWLTTPADNVGARQFYEREGLRFAKSRAGRQPGYRICWYDWRPGPPSRPRAFSASLRKQFASQTRSKAR